METIHASYFPASNRAMGLLLIARDQIQAQLSTLKQKRLNLAQRIMTLKAKARNLGFAQGQKAARREVLEKLVCIEREFSQQLIITEQRCYELILQIAEEVIGTEVKANPQSLERRIKSALNGIVSNQKLTLFAHPSQVKHLGQIFVGCEVLPDPEINEGSAAIKSASGSILVDWKKHLKEIELLLCKRS